MRGGPGNDIMNGGAGDEFGMRGDGGNDVMYGGEGNEEEMNGGEGDDKLYHSHHFEDHDGGPTNSDGFTDRLDCGPGEDEAWINVNTDHDVVKNCETVHDETS